MSLHRLFWFQLKYKKRLYKLLNLDEKQLKALHTRSNLKRFLEYVNNSQVEKIAKLCAKGLDPNFHCPETGGKFGTNASFYASRSLVIIVVCFIRIAALLAHSLARGSCAGGHQLESHL